MGFDSKLNLYIYLSILIALLTVICIVIQLVIIKKILRFDRTTLVRHDSGSEITRQKEKDPKSTSAEKYNNNQSDTEAKQIPIGQKSHQEEIITESIKSVESDHVSPRIFKDTNNHLSQNSEDTTMTETKDTLIKTSEPKLNENSTSSKVDIVKSSTESSNNNQSEADSVLTPKIKKSPVISKPESITVKETPSAVEIIKQKEITEKEVVQKAAPVEVLENINLAVQQPKEIVEEVKVVEEPKVVIQEEVSIVEPISEIEPVISYVDVVHETVTQADETAIEDVAPVIEPEVLIVEEIAIEEPVQHIENVAPKIKLANNLIHETPVAIEVEKPSSHILIEEPEVIIEDTLAVVESIPDVEPVPVEDPDLVQETVIEATPVLEPEEVIAENSVFEEPVQHIENVAPKIKLASDLLVEPVKEVNLPLEEAVVLEPQYYEELSVENNDVLVETSVAEHLEQQPAEYIEDFKIQSLEANIKPIRFTEAFIEKQQNNNLESMLPASDLKIHQASESVAEFFQSIDQSAESVAPTVTPHDVKVITAPIEEIKEEEDDYSYLIIKPIPIHFEQDEGKKPLILPPESVLDPNSFSNSNIELEQDLTEKNKILSISEASSMQTKVNETNLSYQLFDYSDKFLTKNEVVRKDVSNFEEKNVNELDLARTFANKISNLDANKELDFKKILDTYQKMADRYK